MIYSQVFICISTYCLYVNTILYINYIYGIHSNNKSVLFII